ncbi:MAG: hypothetical protein ACOC2C_03140 [Cyclonatronaceae bacterium]
MHISSAFHLDQPQPKSGPGSYEWWYFDAADAQNKWHLVVIYYDGCPFSTAYNRAVEEHPERARPAGHPAITVSLYYEGKPVFYSTSEYPPAQAAFYPEIRPLNEHLSEISLKIGKNSLSLRYDNTHKKLEHHLFIDETLPSGDKLSGRLVFRADAPEGSLFGQETAAGNTLKPSQDGHGWNLTQPRASVDARLELHSAVSGWQQIEWTGIGYHDHNLGSEPMRNEFTDWYWGRFHFPEHTLIYYLMRTEAGLSYKAWLLDGQLKLQHTLTSGHLEGFMSNAFMLPAARIIELKEENGGKEGVKVMIQQSQAIDSGPFYYRFLSEAILDAGAQQRIEQAKGITEYIRPARIHYRLFWPLVHMRYRYVAAPHWVQRSPRLYRWTW